MLAYNLMMLAIVAVCLAAIHLAFDERKRWQAKKCFASVVASIKKEWSVEASERISDFELSHALERSLLAHNYRPAVTQPGEPAQHDHGR